MNADCLISPLARAGGLGHNGFLNGQTLIREAPFSMAATLSELLQRGQDGDLQAMEEIYERFKGPLFSLAYRHTYDRAAAEDILQDTFVKILTHLRDVESEETFSAWVYRIAVNTCYSHLRSRRSREKGAIALSQVEGQREEGAYDGHEESLSQPLEEAIGELPEKLKTVFVLHDIEGFKHEEIARLLGFTAGTSKSQLFKARLRIRKYLREKKGITREV